MKILITGISGFVGSYLAEYCLSIPGTKIYGTFLASNFEDEVEKIKHIKDKINLVECNLLDKRSVFKILNEIKPDKIFHLAGQSSVKYSWESPEKIISENITSQLNIFESLIELKIDPIIHVACSSEEYGIVNNYELPIKENTPLRPLSPYAVSKVCQETMALQYFKSYKLKTVITRAFNHEGPRRPEQFAISDFAKQIAEIEKKKSKPVIFVGNLEVQRDYSDVRDIVEAYWLATEKCNYGEPYNICSGESRSIGSVLNFLISQSTEKNIVIEQDKSRLRPSDISIIVGDCSKFINATGWKRKILLEKTFIDILNYWREKT